MAPPESEDTDLRRRVQRLEQELAALRATRVPGEGSWQARKEERLGPSTAATPAEATQRLMEAARAVQEIARRHNDRMLFVASGGPQGGAAGGPESVRHLAGDGETAAHLAQLGAAVGHPTRVRMLQALLLDGERTTAELAAASGASGGNLYQHLGELHAVHLLYQPERGRYRLTANGQHAAEVLFWCALQVRRSLPPEFHQGDWYPPEASAT